MTSYLEPLGQRYIGFSEVQCYPKCIKATWHKIFSYEMLPGAFRTTQDRVLTCTVLSQEYKGKIAQEFILCNVV